MIEKPGKKNQPNQNVIFPRSNIVVISNKFSNILIVKNSISIETTFNEITAIKIFIIFYVKLISTPILAINDFGKAETLILSLFRKDAIKYKLRRRYNNLSIWQRYFER